MTTDPKMNEAPLSRVECLAACKRFVEWGLQFALLSILGSPHASTAYRSKVEVETEILNDVFNVAVRGGQNPDGSLTMFGVRVEEDYNLQVPLHEMPVYGFLRGIGTLCFEVGNNTAVFVLKCDPFINISEHRDYRERIYPSPLTGATLVSETGWVGWGVMYDARGRSARVTCNEAEPLNVRDFPVVLDALKKSGRVRVPVSNAYVGNVVTGPPLL
jgi:hypothetical protein